VILKSSLVTFLVVFISSCAGHSKVSLPPEAFKDIVLNYELFDATSQQDNISDDIFYLTPEQKTEVLTQVNERIALGEPKHEALSKVLQSRLGNFTYYGETYNAEKATRLNKGNCMSLAVLTGAFAELMGLEYSFRELTTLPIFDKQNNLILSSSHVQSILYDDSFLPEDDVIYFSKPSIVIDYFPDNNDLKGRRVSKSAFISMYYKNLAADALIKDQLSEAFSLAEKSYQYDRSNIAVINLLGVIHRRAGDNRTAENIYKAGMEVDSSHLILMSNYMVLLNSEQRFAEAEQIEQRIDLLDDPNPYQWLEQAYAAKNNIKAALYFQKALKKAPYLHQAYMGLYQIHLAKGEKSQAKQMLSKALEWSYEVEERKLYKYKLYSLR
jgi:Tfp pilus assembly protein PilF